VVEYSKKGKKNSKYDSFTYSKWLIPITIVAGAAFMGTGYLIKKAYKAYTGKDMEPNGLKKSENRLEKEVKKTDERPCALIS